MLFLNALIKQWKTPVRRLVIKHFFKIKDNIKGMNVEFRKRFSKEKIRVVRDKQRKSNRQKSIDCYLFLSFYTSYQMWEISDILHPNSAISTRKILIIMLIKLNLFSLTYLQNIVQNNKRSRDK